jgi:hypothetical protein
MEEWGNNRRKQAESSQMQDGNSPIEIPIPIEA